MKKIVLFAFLILLFSSSTFSQPYHSLFTKDTTRWDMFRIAMDYGYTNAYYSFSDTILAGKFYHTIYKQQLDFTDQPLGQSSYICGFIREDTTIGKYWFLKNFNDTIIEVLLMDLSLSKGDTFKLVTNYQYLTVEAAIVDSVYFLGNRKAVELKKYYYDEVIPAPIKATFIDGIGPTSGFFMAEENEYFGQSGLLCKFHNNEHIYSSPTADSLGSCFYSGGGFVNKNNIDDWISVFPNPALSKINFRLKNLNYSLTYIYLYNSSGNLILSRPLSSDADCIDIAQNGIYLLKVVSGNIVLNKKIVVIGN